MAKPKKITQNINKDAGLMDLPKVRVPRAKWETKHSNYITSNIGDIVPIYVSEVLPSERRRITMGMLSHMETPIAPILNAQYTELRSFFVPFRLASDLLNGYSTRKSPWVKVFGEDNASTGADIIVPLALQKLPKINASIDSNSSVSGHLASFGGILDALDYEDDSSFGDLFSVQDLNWLAPASYELIYQHAYRNENRESATNSQQYKFLFNVYNRAIDNVIWDDNFHKANREKDYFTGSQPFTQKSSAPISAPLNGEAVVKFRNDDDSTSSGTYLGISSSIGGGQSTDSLFVGTNSSIDPSQPFSAYADLTTATGVSIEQLRVMIKTQELLEKDMMYGTKYIESLNAHFGTAPMSLVLDEPLELKKVTITTQMQPIFQTSTTDSEPTILGTIGANSTTQSGEFEIVPETEFKEYGYLIICACHKAQNAYDSRRYKPKHIFKFDRFSYYTPELNDLGYSPILRKEFQPSNYIDDLNEAVSFNEAFSEYRYEFNKIHGFFEPSRLGALSYWALGISSYSDVQSLYKQDVTELDNSISVTSDTAPQFFDAYGFIETSSKPMSLHSIPGMDGVI